jgi:predicted aldo/keto reductase-like oxidoreductase
MGNFVPFSDEEHRIAESVREAIRAKNLIGCTACNYCTTVCPKDVFIPQIFNLVNKNAIWPLGKPKEVYDDFLGKHGRAGDCIGCGACEGICPQGLPIRELLRSAAEIFEK